MEIQTLDLNEEKTETKEAKTGFWRRQFQFESTPKQKVFDWVFGVVLPTICCLFDPAIFKGAMSHNGAILGEYKPFAYLLSFISILMMMLFLMFGKKLKWFNAILAGLFLVGSAVCLIVGIILFPFSLFGLIILIGALGFTPLFSAFVYSRNALRAIDFAEPLMKKMLLFNLIGVSAIFSFVLPYVFYANVENLLRKMESGDSTVILQQKNKLKYVSPFINIDRLASKTCGAIDDQSKNEIRKAVYELSGKTAEEIGNQYCYDW